MTNRIIKMEFNQPLFVYEEDKIQNDGREITYS